MDLYSAGLKGAELPKMHEGKGQLRIIVVEDETKVAGALRGTGARKLRSCRRTHWRRGILFGQRRGIRPGRFGPHASRSRRDPGAVHAKKTWIADSSSHT